MTSRVLGLLERGHGLLFCISSQNIISNKPLAQSSKAPIICNRPHVQYLLLIPARSITLIGAVTVALRYGEACLVSRVVESASTAIQG